MTQIPEREVEFGRRLAALATEFGLWKLTASYRPGFNSSWSDDISFQWESGRHEADTKKFCLSSTLYHREEH